MLPNLKSIQITLLYLRCIRNILAALRPPKWPFPFYFQALHSRLHQARHSTHRCTIMRSASEVYISINPWQGFILSWGRCERISHLKKQTIFAYACLLIMSNVPNACLAGGPDLALWCHVSCPQTSLSGRASTSACNSALKLASCSNMPIVRSSPFRWAMTAKHGWNQIQYQLNTWSGLHHLGAFLVFGRRSGPITNTKDRLKWVFMAEGQNFRTVTPCKAYFREIAQRSHVRLVCARQLPRDYPTCSAICVHFWMLSAQLVESVKRDKLRSDLPVGLCTEVPPCAPICIKGLVNLLRVSHISAIPPKGCHFYLFVFHFSALRIKVINKERGVTNALSTISIDLRRF